MCQIESLFLLKRLDGSMSGDKRDFNDIETRAVIKSHSPPARQGAEGNHAILTETLGEHAPAYTTINHWLAEFKRGDFSTYIFGYKVSSHRVMLIF